MSGTNTSTSIAVSRQARVNGPVQVSVSEDAAIASFDTAALLANAVDFDPGAALSVTGVRLVAADGTALPVSLDAAGTLSLDPAGAAFQGLGQGQTTDVMVDYSITDGVDTVAAQAVFHVTGVNDAPVVDGAAGGMVVNDGGTAGSLILPSLLGHAHDPDRTDRLSVVIDPADLPKGASFTSTPEHIIPGHIIPAQFIPAGPRGTSWGNYVYPATVIPAVVVPDQIIPATTVLTLDPSDASYRGLAQGEELDIVVRYQVTDGIASTPGEAVFTVNGMNDAPVVSGPLTTLATEDGATIVVNALTNATDVDHGTVLSVVAAPQLAAPPVLIGGIGDESEIEAEAQAAVAAAGAAATTQALDPATLPAGVSFDAATNSFSLDPANAAYQSLSAGQTTAVTVNYGVSDGITTTAASIVFTVTGTNDAPVVSGPATGVTVTEDGVAGVYDHASLLAHASDVDSGDILDVQIDDTKLPAGVVYHHVPGYTTSIGISTTYYGAITSYVDVRVAAVDTLTLDAGSPAYQSLARGETMDVEVDYAITDGTISVPTKAIFHVTGANDAPAVAGSATAAVAEDGSPVTVNGLGQASDVDHGATLRVVAAPPPVTAGELNLSKAGVNETTAAPPPPILPFDPATLPAGMSFDATTNNFSLDPSNAAYQSLSAGQTMTVTVGYGVTDGIANTPASVTFTVTGANDAPVVSTPLSLAVTATTSGVPVAALPLSANDLAKHEDVLPPWVETSLTNSGLTAAQEVNSVYMLAHASDIDQNDTLSVTGLPAALPAGIIHTQIPGYYTPSPIYYGAPVYHPTIDLLTIDPSNAAFRNLAAGETATYTVNYGITDGVATVPASASFTVTGVNDAPVVPNPVTVTSEDSPLTSIALMSTAYDPDHGGNVSLAGVQTVLPAGITYDAATQTLSLDPSNAAFQSLAEGQMANYAVSFSVTDGTLVTPASAIFIVRGVNDAPIVTGPMTGTANEDGAVANIDPFLSVTDIDTPLEALRVTGLPANLPAGVTFNAATQKFLLDPTNAAYQSLSLGETKTVSIAFGVTDGYATVPATAVFTVTGRNDAPLVSGVVNGGTTTAQGAPVTLNLLANASDVDHLDTLAVNTAGTAKVTAAVTSGTWATPVSFTLTNNQVVLDPKQFATLPVGSTVGLTFNYQVTDGNPGGATAASATVAIQGTYVPIAPKGVTMADVTASLAKAQAGGGINSKVALATFAQTGGTAADTYAYTLGGTGAGSFTLATAGNVATLSSGSSSVTGAASGQLYALTVTATDTTNGLAAPASSVDVVVGAGKGSNTINLASLPSMVSTTPSFIYDLGGSDTINGTGMKGALWFDGGQGADTMTGGSGVNTYLYGSTTDSTATAMDIITNFHVGVDMIDLTGTGAKFTSVGALSSTATTIGANAIGWQSSGGNTFLYANTSGNSQSLATAAMKIELFGAVPLSGGVIAHL